MDNKVNKMRNDQYELKQILSMSCLDELKNIQKKIAKRLNKPYIETNNELFGYISLVKGRLFDGTKITLKKLDDVKNIISNNILYSVNNILDSFRGIDETIVIKKIEQALKEREEGLDNYWINIGTELDKFQENHLKKYTNQSEEIYKLAGMIEKLIEPLLRLDSVLFIEAYNEENEDSVQKNKLWDLLNVVYPKLLKKNVQNHICKNIKGKKRLDSIRILRNAFKHGNFVVDSGICILKEKGMENIKYNLEELFKVFASIFNLRIFCRTVESFIINIYKTCSPQLEKYDDKNIKVRTTDINAYFINKGIKVWLDDDIFSDNLMVNGKVCDIKDKYVYFNIYILIYKDICNLNKIQKYIYIIVKAYEDIFPYMGIEKDEVMCLINVMVKENLVVVLYSKFNDIQDIVPEKVGEVLRMKILESE